MAVRKWGNSLALRIPKSVAEEAKIRQGTVVEVSVVEGKLGVTPVAERSYRLSQLLSKITKRNLHAELDTGDRVGRESW